MVRSFSAGTWEPLGTISLAFMNTNKGSHCATAGVRLASHLERLKRESPELFNVANEAVEAVSREENHPSASLVARFVAHCLRHPYVGCWVGSDKSGLSLLVEKKVGWEALVAVLDRHGEQRVTDELILALGISRETASVVNDLLQANGS